MASASRWRVDRALDTSELVFLAFHDIGAYLTVQVATIGGPLDVDLLRRGLAHVQERHSILRARIRRGATPSLVTPESAPIPLLVASAEADPFAIAQEELHRLFDVDSDPLWRCTLVPASEPDTHHLVLKIHHAIADGRSAWRVLADVLEACSALLGGRPLSPLLEPSLTLDEALPPAPLRASLAHRLRRLRQRLRRVRPAEPELPAKPLRSAFLRHTLDAPSVDALRAAARANGATVGGAVAAALMRARARQMAARPRVRLSHGVCLRGSARPPISLESVGCFATSVETRHHVDPQRPLWGLAREVTADLRTLGRRGEAVAAVRASRGKWATMAQAVRPAAGALGAQEDETRLALSNEGVLELAPLDPLELRAWCVTTAAHVAGASLQLSCATVTGALSSTLVHVEPVVPRAVASEILNGFAGDLEEAAHRRCLN